MILKYEDLVYKKEEVVNIIVKFFEKNFNIKFNSNDEKIANIVESTSFKKLKSLESKHGFAEASSGAFFRRGEKNQWKNELNVQQIARLENKFRDFINKFSYD